MPQREERPTTCERQRERRDQRHMRDRDREERPTTHKRQRERRGQQHVRVRERGEANNARERQIGETDDTCKRERKHC